MKVLSFLSIFGIKPFPVSVSGSAVILDSAKPSELAVSFSSKNKQTSPNYFVLDTDYDNYSLVYSCRDEKDIFNRYKKVEYAWILTRSKDIKTEVLNALKNKLASVGADPSKLTVTVQNC